MLLSYEMPWPWGAVTACTSVQRHFPACPEQAVRDLREAEPRLRQASQEKAELAGRPPLLQSKGQLRGSACVLPQLPQVAFFVSCALHHVALALFPGY